MNKIKLFNRDGANMWLEQIEETNDKTSLWQLKVDKEHLYCLKYIRVIFEKYPSEILAVDPSGGPYISIGSELENGKYKIIDFLNSTIFKLLKNGNSK